MINLLCSLASNKRNSQALIMELGGLSEEEWESLIGLAYHHGLTALLFNFIIQEDLLNCVSTKQLEGMREKTRLNAVQNIIFLQEARLLFESLRKLNIDVIGLKGLYLLDNIYSDISLRPMSDLDILLKKEDIPTAMATVESLGYQISTYFDLADENIDIKHVPPFIKDEKLYLELHWTLLEENEPFTIGIEGLWERAQPAQIAGLDVLALSMEDLICHLCLHLGYQHHLSLGLHGLYDIVAVLRHLEGEVDWQKLEEIARGWGAEQVVWLTLTLVQELLGGEIPQEVLMRLQPENAEPWVLAEAKTQLLGRGGHAVPMTPDLAALAAEKGLFRRIKLILSRIFLPRVTLARLYDVPPTSIRIYGCYFRRFYELIKQYGGVVRSLFKQNARALQGAENQQAVGRLRKWMGN